MNGGMGQPPFGVAAAKRMAGAISLGGLGQSPGDSYLVNAVSSEPGVIPTYRGRVVMVDGMPVRIVEAGDRVPVTQALRHYREVGEFGGGIVAALGLSSGNVAFDWLRFEGTPNRVIVLRSALNEGKPVVYLEARWDSQETVAEVSKATMDPGLGQHASYHVIWAPARYFDAPSPPKAPPPGLPKLPSFPSAPLPRFPSAPLPGLPKLPKPHYLKPGGSGGGGATSPPDVGKESGLLAELAAQPGKLVIGLGVAAAAATAVIYARKKGKL